MTKDNVLAIKYPEYAKEWHPTKNGALTPYDVTIYSNKKVWWLYKHITEDGRVFNFEWETTIHNRKPGCPYLNDLCRALWVGFNDLQTVNPQLAKEWHPTKNGNLKPSDVIANTSKKVWWLLPYDTEDGKHFEFEWQATIASRNQGAGCPFLSNHQVWKDFNDLQTINPQLSKEWHPTKNGTLTPDMVLPNSNQKVWWLLSYDTEDGKHFDFEWEAKINARNNGNSCPYLSGNAVWVGFNDLQTINPQLAKEWHPTKNGTLTPSDVTCNSSKKIWWLLPYDDPITNKHFDFEWQASVYSRNNGTGCPYLDCCTNPTLYKGFNDLATRNPQLVKEWHPTKNGTLTPSDVTCGSHKNVWWLLSYKTKDGKIFNFEWQALIKDRHRGNGCPYLRNSKLENLLKSIFYDNNISFISEYKFSDCKDNKPLPFDFYLPNENIVIECDGIQHFEPIDFFGGMKHFTDVQKKDNIKTKYCKNNNKLLLRIPYIYDSKKDKDKIIEIVLDFIKTKRISQEIIMFYERKNNLYGKIYK